MLVRECYNGKYTDREKNVRRKRQGIVTHVGNNFAQVKQKGGRTFKKSIHNLKEITSLDDDVVGYNNSESRSRRSSNRINKSDNNSSIQVNSNEDEGIAVQDRNHDDEGYTSSVSSSSSSTDDDDDDESISNNNTNKFHVNFPNKKIGLVVTINQGIANVKRVKNPVLKKLDVVLPGDRILTINGMIVNTKSHEEFGKQINEAKRPVRIGFSSKITSSRTTFYCKDNNNDKNNNSSSNNNNNTVVESKIVVDNKTTQAVAKEASSTGSSRPSIQNVQSLCCNNDEDNSKNNNVESKSVDNTAQQAITAAAVTITTAASS